MTGLVCLQIKTKIVSSHTADSKPVKQEVSGTMMLLPLVFPVISPNIIMPSVVAPPKLKKISFVNAQTRTRKICTSLRQIKRLRT